MLSLKFLLKKYNIDYITEATYNYNDYFLHWNVENSMIIGPKRNLYVSKVMNNYIKESLYRTKPKFLVFPIILHDSNSIYDQQYTTNINLSHLIVILYNLQNGFLEYFDSANNFKFFDAHLLFNVFINYIRNNFQSMTINYIMNVNQYDNNLLGIQHIQEKEIQLNEKSIGNNIGLCAIYTLWYIEKRLLYKDDDPNIMIKREILNNCSLTKMILDYRLYLYQMCINNIKIIKNNKKHFKNKYIDKEIMIDLIHIFEENEENEKNKILIN